jgi:two-component system chemotaxis sensor kinase CheA
MEQLRAAGDNGPQARKLLDALFRSVHNLKATASANGLTSLAAAAHEFENVLHALRKDSVQQPLAEGSRLFLVQTDFDVSDFDRQFQSLKETLSKTGEVISTEPGVNKERPGKVNFKILYAASQIPAELPLPITVEEISVVKPTATNTLEQQMPVLERAFQKFASELRTISVDDVLAQALRAGEAVAQATGKHVNFEVRGDASLLDELPPDRIAGVLLHLVRNAVDHGIETRGKVIIEFAKHDDQIAITVADDGRGIEPAVMSQIFQPGFSTKDEASEISGRGVGLDVVKTSIEELGGTVTVRSNPGQGTSFELTLPIHSV